MVCQKWSFRSTGRPGYGIPTLLRLKYDLRHFKILLSTWLMYFPLLDNINYIKLYFHIIWAFGPNSSDSETGIDWYRKWIWNTPEFNQDSFCNDSYATKCDSANTRRCPNVVLMFDRRLRFRPNIKTTLGQRLVSAGVAVILAGCWRGCDACFLLVDSIMPCWPYNKLTAGRRSLVVGYTWSAAIGNRFMYNLWPTSDKTFQLVFSDAGHAGPALNLHWVNVSCVLGLDKYNIQYT